MNLKDAPHRWEEVCALNETRFLMGAAIFKDCLVVVGGVKNEDRHQTNTGEFYFPALNKWHQISALPQHRSGHELVTCNNGLYALGGLSKKQFLCSVERLNILDGEWEKVKPMNSARAFFAAVSYNEMVYAIGGTYKNENDKWIASQTVEKFNPVENKWTFVSNLIHARYYHATCLMQNKIFVVGGYDKNKEAMKIIECYDPTTDKWTAVDETENDLYGHALVAL